MSVSRHIGQNLLENPEECRSRLLTRAFDGLCFDLTANSHPPRKTRGLPFDRSLQPQLVEHWWTQVRGNSANRLKSSINHPLHLLNLSNYRIESPLGETLREPTLDPRQIDPKKRQRLAEFIMHLPCYANTFFLPCRLITQRQFTKLLAG